MLISGTDLETTGLNLAEHRIIELCVASYDWDGTTAKHLGTKTWRIDPQRSIDAGAQKVHGISASDLIGKPTWDVVAPEIVEELNNADVVVGHNGYDFDFTFIVRELERIRQTLPDFIPFDTMVHGRWSTPMGKAPNLRELCFACGIPYDPSKAHAAEYDTMRMMECFFFGLNRGVFTLPTT